MKTILSLIFALSFNLLAELPTEVDKLKDNYTTAIKKATDPINTVYKQELQKLLEKYKKLANLAEVAKINNELKNIGVDVATVEDNIPLDPKSIKSVEKLIVNKAWKTPFGTTFHFEKDGKGWKMTGADKSAFTWRIVKDNIVEFTGRTISTSPIKTEFFRFVSKTEAYSGGKSVDDQIISPLTPAN